MAWHLYSPGAQNVDCFSVQKIMMMLKLRQAKDEANVDVCVAKSFVGYGSENVSMLQKVFGFRINILSP